VPDSDMAAPFSSRCMQVSESASAIVDECLLNLCFGVHDERSSEYDRFAQGPAVQVRFTTVLFVRQTLDVYDHSNVKVAHLFARHQARPTIFSQVVGPTAP
jgi:hypothetical protein